MIDWVAQPAASMKNRQILVAFLAFPAMRKNMVPSLEKNIAQPAASMGSLINFAKAYPAACLKKEFRIAQRLASPEMTKNKTQ